MLHPRATRNSHALSLSAQSRIIEQCIQKGERLADALSHAQLSYDDLRYEGGVYRFQDGSSYFPLDEFRRKGNSLPLVSFFSGAGGLDLGFEAAGFTHTALVENNPLFCQTLRLNKTNWQVIGPPDSKGDVSEIEVIESEIARIIGKSSAGFEGVFIGGPPCQPFSIAANQRFNKSGSNFKRTGFAHELHGNLLFDFVELIKVFRPAAFLIENVPGLLEIDGGAQLAQIYLDLEKSGYSVHAPTILVAANHRVPQNRTRLFVVGNRLGASFSPPAPSEHRLNCAGAFARSCEGLANHINREHSASSIQRYMKLGFGERDQLGRVDRLDPDLPSKTVIAGGTGGGGRSHLHPLIPRTLTVRECAILQTFPDKYSFCGPVARQFTQVGNAVPPVLAAQLASAMRESIFC